MKILLCEDDPSIGTIAKMSLEHIGQHTVTWVTDGEQALKLGSSGDFDLILLDDMMPKMSGVKVCHSFVQNASHKTPVIFMSANPQGKRVEEFHPVAIGYIPKPFEPVDLNNKIQELIESKLKKAI